MFWEMALLILRTNIAISVTLGYKIACYGKSGQRDIQTHKQTHMQTNSLTLPKQHMLRFDTKFKLAGRVFDQTSNMTGKVTF